MELLPVAEGGAFVPDPQLSLLTSGGSAPKLVTDQVAPQRGHTPPARKAGTWDDDAVLQLEGALEVAQNLCSDAGVLRLSERQVRRLTPLWGQLIAALGRAGLAAP